MHLCGGVTSQNSCNHLRMEFLQREDSIGGNWSIIYETSQFPICAVFTTAFSLLLYYCIISFFLPTTTPGFPGKKITIVSKCLISGPSTCPCGENYMLTASERLWPEKRGINYAIRIWNTLIGPPPSDHFWVRVVHWPSLASGRNNHSQTHNGYHQRHTLNLLIPLESHLLSS